MLSAAESGNSRVKRINSSAWNSDPQLVAAKPAFDEMRRIADDHLGRKDAAGERSELQLIFSEHNLWRSTRMAAAGY